MADLKGMTSMAYTASDPVALAKALDNYAKANAQFTFKAGMVEGRVIDLEGDQRSRHHAAEGRDLREASVPDQCVGAAPGDCR